MASDRSNNIMRSSRRELPLTEVRLDQRSNLTVGTIMDKSTVEKLRSIISIECPWLFVSAYYNLDSYQDASMIGKRSSSFYRQRLTIFEFDLPLIFYCSPDMYDDFCDLARKKGCSRTHIIPLPFEQFELYDQLPSIVHNRQRDPHYQNERNTPPYALLVMSKLDLMARTAHNIPGDTMLAWLDYSYDQSTIDRFRPQLNKLLNTPSNYFPTKYMLGLISWVPNIDHYNIRTFYHRRLKMTTFCGGFHFGLAKLVPNIWHHMREITLDTIELGYGHGEEQIFFTTFLQFRHLFDYYPTDYGYHIFGMFNPRYNTQVVYGILLPRLLNCKELAMAHSVANQMLKSAKAGIIVMNEQQRSLCRQAQSSYQKK